MGSRLPNPGTAFLPEASECKEAISWLLSAGVSRATLASSLCTSAKNISTLAHRASLNRRLPSPPSFGTEKLQTALARPLTFEESESLRKRRDALDPERLEAELDGIFQRHAPRGDHAGGIDKLKQFRPKLGRPTKDARLLWLLARYYYYTAWLFNIAGFSRSAIENASSAYVVAVDLHRYRGGPEPLQLVVDAAVIASNAYLGSDTDAAISALKVAEQAAERGALLNQYYWRQVALAFLQQDSPREALDELGRAKYAAANCTETAADAAEIVLIHDLFANFAKRNWDGENGALESIQTVAKRYSPGSLERSFALKWAVAAGLSIDSREIHKQALELLDNNFNDLSHFGHHATFAHLMRIADALPPSRRIEFVTTFLHYSAFRNS
jgi:hypothetical protein